MEEEYRASGAGKVFKAPQPELTDEEKKQQIDMENELSLIHISEPTTPHNRSYAVLW